MAEVDHGSITADFEHIVSTAVGVTATAVGVYHEPVIGSGGIRRSKVLTVLPGSVQTKQKQNNTNVQVRRGSSMQIRANW